VAEPQRILRLVMLAGQTLLENGAEIFRVEETMTIMARSFGLADFHPYVLTNGLFTSADGAGLSAVRNVPCRTVNLARVEAVNEISREAAAGTLTLEQAERRMAAARGLPGPSVRAQVAASAAGSFCFAALFGADLPQALVALAAGGVLGGYLCLCEKNGVTGLLRRLSGAALLTALCLLLSLPLGTGAPNGAIIGALMILTPGVAMTMGIRDFLRADYLSGTIRLIDALLIAGSIAVGTGLVLGLYGWLMGVSI
jgi:uncharacterized membrane protein YjjP (DUF1212 family)